MKTHKKTVLILYLIALAGILTHLLTGNKVFGLIGYVSFLAVTLQDLYRLVRQGKNRDISENREQKSGMSEKEEPK